MIVAGCDEAGYGPKLGPLVVGCSAFVIEGEALDELELDARGLAEPPDLWDLLSHAVRREGKGDKKLLWVADSKAIKPRKDGLKQLELGVLAFRDQREATTLGELLSMLGAPCVRHQAWFGDLDEVKVPVHAWTGEVASRAERLVEARERGVRFLGSEVAVLDARTYNQRVAETRNKGAVLEESCVSLLRSLRAAAEGPMHVTMDKHGGRSTYLRLLGRAFPMAKLEIMAEGQEESVYEVESERGWVRVEFRKSAEDRSLPVALSSMHCKYLRELLMERFNAWFSERIPGVKPTAGYASDAKRFLADVADDLERLGVAEECLVRTR